MTSKILLKAAKDAVMHEKPHSSISFWVDKMCADRDPSNSLNGLPELVDSINLQPTGPQEASRAIRKKLKYGSTDTQIRALMILRALTENANERFRLNFADSQLIERLRTLAGDPVADKQVKRALLSVLLSWKQQFGDSPQHNYIASLYDSVKGGGFDQAQARAERQRAQEDQQRRQARAEEAERREQERRDRKYANRIEEQERKAAKKSGRGGQQRQRFDFEKEKPNIMQAVASASQACNGLVNALQHVQRDMESVTTNTGVQEYLAKTKEARRKVVRYTQLIDCDPSGDFIGMLLSTNEQILAALSLYDRWSHPVDLLDADEEAEAAELAATAQGKKDDQAAASLTAKTKQMNLGAEGRAGELNHLQDRQKAEVQRHLRRQESYHSQRQQQPSGPKQDLADLMFDSPAGLPEPMKPVHVTDVDSHDSLDDGLSDFSDYSSSDEEEHYRRQQQQQAAQAGPSSSNNGAQHRGYTEFLQPDERKRFDANQKTQGSGLANSGEDDPFADPFADQGDVLTPGINEKQRMEWRAV